MTTYLDTKAAAQYMNEQIPDESLKYWTARLNNMRRTDRPQTFSLQFAKVEGKAGFYDQKDIFAYAEFEKSRRIGKVKLSGRAAEAMRAFGIGEQGGGTQGRRWMGASVNPAVANDGSGVFVQTIISEPLMVFAMTPEQALKFGKDLVEIGQYAQRSNSTEPGQAPDLSKYKTVTDTGSMLVKRRVEK